MKILAFDFSSSQRSVAIVWHDESTGKNGRPESASIPDNETVLSVPEKRIQVHGPGAFATVEALETGGRTVHAFALVDQVLREARLEREQVECLVVGIGPGSYTGIRAAIALAQGWQLAGSIKLRAIPAPESIAADALDQGLQGPVAVIIDAQRNEFYCANYHLAGHACSETGPLRLLTAEAVLQEERAGNLLIGPDLGKSFPQARPVYPRAAMLGKLAQGRNDFLAGEKIEPVYLRETTFVKVPPSRPLRS